MGMFNFFGDSEHKVFDYKPIYYDKEQDELKQKFAAVDGTRQKEKQEGTYVPGAALKGAFRDGNYQRTRDHSSRSHSIIGIVALLLVFGILFYIAKFYSIL